MIYISFIVFYDGAHLRLLCHWWLLNYFISLLGLCEQTRCYVKKSSLLLHIMWMLFVIISQLENVMVIVLLPKCVLRVFGPTHAFASLVTSKVQTLPKCFYCIVVLCVILLKAIGLLSMHIIVLYHSTG